ncbi:MAG: HD-GYP domain-containing protein [Deltaproteobacteria bacterium]|nr:HD-GYP domain-containing protein [Deltaproteobacteria bacterium]
MLKKISTLEVKTGMFVAQLDRSWMETPFIFHKFQVKSVQQVDQLQTYCRFVYIDTEKGGDTDSDPPGPGLSKEPVLRVVEGERKSSPEGKPDSVPWQKELPVAREIHRETKKVVDNILEDVRLGKTIDTTAAKKSVENIVDSVMRNRDALVCLSQLKSRDEYTAFHSMNVCILSVAFGRTLNLPREDLQLLGVGGLLHDIGKMKVPLEILNKPDKLTEAEFEEVKNHVRYGEELLAQISQIPAKVVKMVAQHHERYNGKGYLQGLQGEQLSLFGQISTIVDVYDAMTSDRVYRSGLLPNEALKKMFVWSATDFNQGLFERFVKSIGIYPVGSLVEINRSEIGIVIAANQENTVKPTVKLIKNRDGQIYRPALLIDTNAKDGRTGREKFQITGILKPHKEGITISTFFKEPAATVAR